MKMAPSPADHIITARRSNRSARTPANGVTTIEGRSLKKLAIATQPAEPVTSNT